MVLLSRSSSSNTSSLLCFIRRKISKNPNEMRIADVLSDHNDEDDDGDEKDGSFKRKRRVLDSSLSFSSSSTRSLISRLLPFNIMKRKKKADSGSSSGSVSCHLKPAAGAEEAGAALPPESRRISELSVDSGRKNEDSNFNLGMGVSLLFLLAKGTAEYNKMVELRGQMEMLFKDIRDKVKRKDAIASSSKSNTDISFSPSHCCEDIVTRKVKFMPTCSVKNGLEEVEDDVGSDTESQYITAFEYTRILNMGQMEAELEVELERLENDCEGDSSTLQQGIKFNCRDGDSSSQSSGANCEEYSEPQDNHHEFNGVCPHELERRLHELLESRQQEKITALEYALQCAERKLREKEMELQLWKETQLGMSLNILQPCAQNSEGDMINPSEANL